MSRYKVEVSEEQPDVILGYLVYADNGDFIGGIDAVERDDEGRVRLWRAWKFPWQLKGFQPTDHTSWADAEASIDAVYEEYLAEKGRNA